MKVKSISPTASYFTLGKIYEMEDIGGRHAGFDDDGGQFYSFDMWDLGDWEVVSYD